MCAALLLVGFTTTTAAVASEPFTENSALLSLSARRGFPLGRNIDANPWSTGVGANYGLTLRGGLYLGLAAQSFPFDKRTERYGSPEETIIEGKLGNATVEIGHDWALLQPLAVRGVLGIGAGWGDVERCAVEEDDELGPILSCDNEKNPRAVFTAGLAVLGRVSHRLFVLADAQWLVDSAFEDHTTGGVVGIGAGYRL